MYEEYLQILWMFLKAFAVGGFICAVAQTVINITDLTAGKILVYFMLAGVVLQGWDCTVTSWISPARALPFPSAASGIFLPTVR